MPEPRDPVRETFTKVERLLRKHSVEEQRRILRAFTELVEGIYGTGEGDRP